MMDLFVVQELKIDLNLFLTLLACFHVPSFLVDHSITFFISLRVVDTLDFFARFTGLEDGMYVKSLDLLVSLLGLSS